MFGDNRGELRKMYQEAWSKHREGKPVTALEAIIADVVALHPEYHAMIESGEDVLDKDWTPEHGETNPFLHMGMHIAIREQVSIDRPPGIRAAHQQLAHKLGDQHEAEHVMHEALAETLWEAQRNGMPPDEQAYLARVKLQAMK
ncbi:MAG: DUF1841 family protein [Gammaproteobacteria bacterium]|nr:DUF1841 family protein [Gammaproteobacteria bacterium]